MRAPGWLLRLEQRFAQREDRAGILLFVAMVWPMLGVLWALQWAPLGRPEVAAAYAQPQWVWMQAVHGAVLVWLLPVAAHAWWWRHRGEPAARLVQLTLVPAMAGLAILSLGHGIKDTPMGMLMLVTFVIGRALFRYEQIRFALWLTLGLIMACEVAQWAGNLPYAFLLTRPVFDGHPLSPWWSLWVRVVFLLATVPLSGVLFLLAWVLMRRRLALRALVLSDALTGLANRRAFMTQLAREAHRHQRHGRPLSILILDIDHFKRINDEWGHATGDEVLVQVGRLLRQHTRERVDLAARYGGEEFVVLLPETDLQGAQLVAEKLAMRLREHPFATKGRALKVTASMGVTQYTGGDPDQALRTADRNLYQAKEAGRDRIVASLS